MAKLKITFFSFFVSFICISQTFTGKVIDGATKLPIETASVYFDNTTIGTTTNEKGAFSITYNDAVQSSLVISYLGYEKVIISDYRSRNNITVALIEANNALDEVNIEYDDGLTRRQKLKLFRQEFLGSSKFAKSCKILNEEDLILKYDRNNKALYASAKTPVKVLNKDLQYEIAFDIIDFEVMFRYVNLKSREFSVNSVTYIGTSFYKNLNDSLTKRTLKNRDLVYNGSIQHFIRSLYNENLKDEGYWIFHDRFRVDEWAYFKLEPNTNSDLKKVTLSDKVTILFNKDLQSELQLSIDHFFIDKYGNYSPVIGVFFSGAMGRQRVGDTLPLNYGLDD